MSSEEVRILKKYLDGQFDKLAQLVVHHNQKLLSVEDISMLMGIAPGTVRNYLSTGKFPLKPIKVGDRTLFKRDEVEAYISSL